jgi:hypothetical protein
MSPDQIDLRNLVQHALTDFPALDHLDTIVRIREDDAREMADIIMCELEHWVEMGGEW